jgi:hypothetical protein
VSTTEELLGRKSTGSGLENREYGRRELIFFRLRHYATSQKVAGSRPDEVN